MLDNCLAQAKPASVSGFGFALTSVRIGDGEPLHLPGPGSVTAVVGANNVGKSTFLNQVFAVLSSPDLKRSTGPAVVTELGNPWLGSEEDLIAWLSVNGRIDDNGAYRSVSRHGSIQSSPLSNVGEIRRRPTPGALAGWFISDHRAIQRSGACDSMPRMESIGNPPQNPMQVLYVDLEKRRRIEEIARRMFAIKLHFDAVSGAIGFRVGDPGVEVPPVNAINEVYAGAVGKLPRLGEQGDGVRSALGLLISLIANENPLSLIDEPEAFLHPPQARLLGQEMAQLAEANRSQLIVATHDKNILQGLVESGAKVSIIHLTRDGDSTTGIELSADDVEALWGDVTLRYGDALDSLFHSAVVITESDRDSRFYHAAIDAASSDGFAHNLMFLGSNGKQNMAAIVMLLRKLGVRTVTCPDLDILNDSKKLQRLVLAHGGAWEDLAQLYKQATNEFSSPTAPPSVEDVRRRLNELLASNAEPLLTQQVSEAIQSLTRVPKTKWSKLKEVGDRAFRADRGAAAKLLEALDSLGIVTVRVGELENFVTDSTLPKGPEFLPAALSAEAHLTREAQDHAIRILKGANILRKT